MPETVLPEERSTGNGVQVKIKIHNRTNLKVVVEAFIDDLHHKYSLDGWGSKELDTNKDVKWRAKFVDSQNL